MCLSELCDERLNVLTSSFDIKLDIWELAKYGANCPTHHLVLYGDVLPGC